MATCILIPTFYHLLADTCIWVEKDKPCIVKIISVFLTKNCGTVKNQYHGSSVLLASVYCCS